MGGEQPGQVRIGHFGLGIIGLGMLRTWTDSASAAARTQELAFLLGVLDDDALSPARRPTQADVREGYAQWSKVYDDQANPLIALEEPIVRDILATIEPGHAVDAACGTGRIAQILFELGHEVHGIDATPEMLERARTKLPGARFDLGTIEELPLPDGVADLTTCTLALAHVDDHAAAVAELARVTRPGGRLVLSDIHPFSLLSGGAATFPSEDPEEWAFVPSMPRLVGQQLASFAAAGLSVRACHEPLADDVIEMMVPDVILPAARAAWCGSPFAIVWDLEKRPT